MTSGRKLTEQQADAILRLAGRQNADGKWALSYRQIAKTLDMHRHTVYRCIRQSAVRYGNRTAWKSEESV